MKMKSTSFRTTLLAASKTFKNGSASFPTFDIASPTRIEIITSGIILSLDKYLPHHAYC